ncbi:putative signal transduction protein with CBS domains [Haloterrigena turkmenica DSM 5511]|uniref:Signal transduction protein with CBS domains n=1 Tax=Haloterrigena turkmenica (strain ATCC 51198 / DSM 5511 / JCM 9101 / NCIMB 13204 / VKM B-1734 / 4k) TaxID=543526 RepID=D2RYR1_HALTV|nr:CBS domain-containing protein [Haloterrigena turkmenica]ADB61879.1 putative signal transduction protein with CBS domains [Haloterrigena turkmenica DSM 5511]
MIDVPLERVLTQPGRTIQPEAPITEAAERLRDPDVSALVVLEDETVVGIVTESDIVAFVAETLEPHPVRTVMSSPVTTISRHESLVAAAETMRTDGVKHLPVVSDGAYCGLVSASTLAPYLSRRRLEIDWEDDPVRIDDDGQEIPVSE